VLILKLTVDPSCFLAPLSSRIPCGNQ